VRWQAYPANGFAMSKHVETALGVLVQVLLLAGWLAGWPLSRSNKTPQIPITVHQTQSQCGQVG